MKHLDIFTGTGAFSAALESLGCHCVGMVEKKPAARTLLSYRYPDVPLYSDIGEWGALPDADILTAGFPCQPFSTAGMGLGFSDKRNAALRSLMDMIKAKRIPLLLLENVPNLLYGHRDAFNEILGELSSMGYGGQYVVSDAANYGIPQKRQRLFIMAKLGHFGFVEIFETPKEPVGFASVYQSDLLGTHSPLSQKIWVYANKMSKKPLHYLSGKTLNDKRGGNTLHSWDLGLFGEVSEQDRVLLETLMKSNRKKSFNTHGLRRSDGIPLSSGQLSEVMGYDVKKDLQRLHTMRYVNAYRAENGDLKKDAAGNLYAVITNKLRFEYYRLITPYTGCLNTLTATDAQKIGVVGFDGAIRALSRTEVAGLFGLSPDWGSLSDSQVFDLAGNAVVVPQAARWARHLIEGFPI